MFIKSPLIKCHANNEGRSAIYTLDYYHAIDKIENVRFKIIKSLAEGRDLMIHIDTTLLETEVRMNAGNYISHLESKLKAYGILYKIKLIKRECNIGRLGIKINKLSNHYKVVFYICFEVLSEKLYKDILENMGCSIFILNRRVDAKELMCDFYSDEIEQDLTQLFYAYFYLHESVERLLVTTRTLKEEKLKTLMTEIV